MEWTARLSSRTEFVLFWVQCFFYTALQLSFCEVVVIRTRQEEEVGEDCKWGTDMAKPLKQVPSSLTPLSFRLVCFNIGSDTFYILALSHRTVTVESSSSLLHSGVFKTCTGVPAPCKHVSDSITLTSQAPGPEVETDQEDLEAELCQLYV